MKLKVTYDIKGKPVTKYYNSEEKAYADVTVHIKSGSTVTEISRYHQ